MPVVATPATPVIVTVDQVRRFMRDYPDNNILIDDVQFSQDDVNQGVEMITSAFNAITPQTRFLPQSWPQHLQFLLLQGVTWYLLQSEVFLQIRNQATYQDGDIAPIGIDDKYSQYQQLAQVLRQSWEHTAQQVKIQNNLESMYGSISSGYRNVSRFHHS
jgi:hypothetical protein